MKPKIVCRVNHVSGDSIWYNADGTPKADFKTKFPWFHNVDLPMPFDDEHVGYISCVENITELMDWCNPKDMENFEKIGYFITMFETDDYKIHKNHLIAKKDSLKFLGFLKINDWLNAGPNI